MQASPDPKRPWRAILLGLGLVIPMAASGCQYEVGGQMLPSPFYMTDDVQYFPPGPEFKLAREAAALKEAAAEDAARQRGRGPQP